MSIIKNTPNILKHSGSSFTTILNSTIEAIKDPATLGIYIYLASKPSDWEISLTNLRNRFDKGRDFIEKRMGELKRLGLMKTIAIKDELGKIIRWETVLFSETQITGFPPSGKTHPLVDPHITNNIYKQIKDNNKPPISPKGESRFNEFWEVYPLKVAKKVCEKIWQRKSMDSMADGILERLGEQIQKDDRWLKGFIPNPSTYLNQERWKDEIILARKSMQHSTSKPVYDDKDTSWIDEVFA